MLLFWAQTNTADLVTHLTTMLLRTPVLFWLQMGVVVFGMIWCFALTCTMFFGGWYAYTHPLKGNDRVILRVARVLYLLMLGLTEYPPQVNCESRNERFNG